MTHITRCSPQLNRNSNSLAFQYCQNDPRRSAYRRPIDHPPTHTQSTRSIRASSHLLEHYDQGVYGERIDSLLNSPLDRMIPLAGGHLAKSSTQLDHHSPREPDPQPKSFLSKIAIPEQIKLRPGAAASAISRGLAYVVIHPIVVLRTRSIAAHLEVPKLNLLHPINAVASSATHIGLEYGMALFICDRFNALLQHHLDQQALTDSRQPATRPDGKAHPLLIICKNLLAATITAGPSLAWERINQQLILGNSLPKAIHNIIGHTADQLKQNPGLAKEFLRGLPIAVASLAVYLTVQDLSNPSTEDNLDQQVETTQSHRASSNFWAVANMAFLGFVGGLVDCTVSNGQLHGLSTLKAIAKTFSHPLTPLSYGLLGAVSLGFIEFALKNLTPAIVKSPESRS